MLLKNGNHVVKFNVFDELNDLMRVVFSKAEAEYLCRIREGWTYKRVKTQATSIPFDDVALM